MARHGCDPAFRLLGSGYSAQKFPRARIWLWPNLLSLDAPAVAVMWQLLFAECFRVKMNRAATVLLPLTVWLIYAADRWLDAVNGRCETRRHRFYHAHWRALLPVWVCALAFAGWLSCAQLPPELFHAGLLLSAAVGVYLIAVHAAPERIRTLLPKEATVGVLFAAGTSIGTWEKIRTVADVGTVVVFSALCWINCMAIERWEQRDAWAEIEMPERGKGWIAERQFPIAVASFCAGLLALIVFAGHRPLLGAAEAASAGGLILLDRTSARFSRDALRVLADVALMSPVLILPIARLG
jgi:hypothetical protein